MRSRDIDPVMRQNVEMRLLDLYKRDFAGALRWGRMTSMVDIEWLSAAPATPDPVLIEAMVLYTLATKSLSLVEIEAMFGTSLEGIDPQAFGQTAYEILLQRRPACDLGLGLLTRGRNSMSHHPFGHPEDIIFVREKVVASYKDGERGPLSLVYGSGGPSLIGEALAARLRAVKVALFRLNSRIDDIINFGDGI